MKKNIAIVLAAGRGSRMGADIPKQFLMMGEKPVLYYSLKVFQDSDVIDEVVLVIGKEYQEYCKEKILTPYGLSKVKTMTEGGSERYFSVYEGLKACGQCDFVFIHDGARPFVSEEIIRRCLNGAKEYRACIAGMPVKDTIKIVDDAGNVEDTPPRERVWQVQTPQVFEYDLIYNAYSEMMRKSVSGITDDAMVIERFSEEKVRMIRGSYENIKITTPEDIKIGEKFLKNSVDNLK